MRSRKDQPKKNRSLSYSADGSHQCPSHSWSHVLQKSLEKHALLRSTLFSHTIDNTAATSKIRFICHCFSCLFPFYISPLERSENRFFSFLSDSQALAQCCNVWVAVSTAGECSLLKINHGNISLGIRSCRSLGFFFNKNVWSTLTWHYIPLKGRGLWCMSVCIVCVCVCIHTHQYTTC